MRGTILQIDICDNFVWEQLGPLLQDSRKFLRQYYNRKPSYKPKSDAELPEEVVLVGRDSHGLALAVVSVENHLDYLYIYKLGVKEEARRKGYARQLITKGCELGLSWGLKVARLKTVESTGNVDIFRRMGFCVIDRAESEIFETPDGQPVIEVTMEKLL